MTTLYNIFGYPFGWVIWALYKVIPNYAIAIILFTLITKLILMPISIKQQKNSAKTALFQPKLEALKKKYGKNQEKYQQELQKLYQQEGANPASSCGPLIIQMLLLFGVYDVVCKPLKHILRISADAIDIIVNTATSAGAKIANGSLQSQLFAFDFFKSNPDKFAELTNNLNQQGLDGAGIVDKLQNFDLNFLGINLGQTPSLSWNLLLIVPILAGVTAFLTSFVSNKINLKNNPAMASQQSTMNIMLFTMPLFSVWIAFSVPAGVGFYWIISNIFMIFQTIVLAKIYTPQKLKEYAEKEAEKRRAASGTYTTVAEEIDEETGEVREVKRQLSDKERIAEARRRMAEKYGDEISDD